MGYVSGIYKWAPPREYTDADERHALLRRALARLVARGINRARIRLAVINAAADDEARSIILKELES